MGRSAGSEGNYSGPLGGSSGLPGGLGGNMGGGLPPSDPSPSGMGNRAGGFGNQGSTGSGGGEGGFGMPSGGGRMDVPGGRGATSVPGVNLPTHWMPKIGGGGPVGGTPTSPPPVNQPPTISTPTGGVNPTSPNPPPPRTQSPTPNPGQDTRYPPGAGVFNYAGTDAYQNSMGQGGPSSPMTPGGMDGMDGMGGTGGTGGSGGGGGRYQPPTRGTGNITNTNTYNIGGDTSSMVTQGNQAAQKTPKKTYKQPKVAMGQKMIGDPKLAMQQLSAMNQTPFMRRT